MQVAQYSHRQAVLLQAVMLPGDDIYLYPCMYSTMVVVVTFDIFSGA